MEAMIVVHMSVCLKCWDAACMNIIGRRKQHCCYCNCSHDCWQVVCWVDVCLPLFVTITITITVGYNFHCVLTNYQQKNNNNNNDKKSKTKTTKWQQQTNNNNKDNKIITTTQQRVSFIVNRRQVICWQCCDCHCC